MLNSLVNQLGTVNNSQADFPHDPQTIFAVLIYVLVLMPFDFRAFSLAYLRRIDEED